MTDVTVLGIDPGNNPGFSAGGLPQPGWWRVVTALPDEWRTFPFDLAIVEAQTVSSGLTHHKGRKFRAGHKTVPTLAMAAGWQLAQVKARRYIAIEPRWWRGLLWDDGALGLYGLAAEEVIRRLRKLQPGLEGHTDDEVEAYGLMLAGERIGNASAGILKDGRKWKLKAQVWGFSFEVESPKRKARKFVRDLLAQQKSRTP